VKRWVYHKPTAQGVVREMLIHTGKYLRDSKKNKDERMAHYLADKYVVLESVLDRLAARGIK